MRVTSTRETERNGIMYVEEFFRVFVDRCHHGKAALNSDGRLVFSA
jgi:hemerythrin-like domain-containing protein